MGLRKKNLSAVQQELPNHSVKHFMNIKTGIIFKEIHLPLVLGAMKKWGVAHH